MDPNNYIELFKELRLTLLTHSSTDDGNDKKNESNQTLIRRELKDAGKLKIDPEMGDDIFWRRMASKPFYARRIAARIKSKENAMLDKLSNIDSLVDERWNKGGIFYAEFTHNNSYHQSGIKLAKSVYAARELVKIRNDNKDITFTKFFLYENDGITLSGMDDIFDRLQDKLSLGTATTFHFMMDIGLPVIKPDRVVNRTVARLGIMPIFKSRNGKTYKLNPKITVDIASKFGTSKPFIRELQNTVANISKITKLTAREIDLILVMLGQEPDLQRGIERTICREEAPLCQLCSANKLCAYAHESKYHKM